MDDGSTKAPTREGREVSGGVGGNWGKDGVWGDV